MKRKKAAALEVGTLFARCGGMMTKIVASAALVLAVCAWSSHRGATTAPAAASAPAPTVRRAFHPAVCTEPPPVPVFDAATDTCQMDAP